ncbi:MAG: hypothetical protein P4L53_26800 [Candidatus Obscuribacterales bacterium]|nr:hypothetical protein [Candidatus Obscuribacterales bacterium]
MTNLSGGTLQEKWFENEEDAAKLQLEKYDKQSHVELRCEFTSLLPNIPSTELERILLERLTHSLLASPCPMFPIAKDLDTVFLDYDSPLMSTYIRCSLNKSSQFFLFRTLVEDTQYLRYPTLNIGQCMALLPMTAFIASLLICIGKLANDLQHDKSKTITVALEIADIKGRILFGDLPFDIGIPSPIFRCAEDRVSIVEHLSTEEIEKQLEDTVDRFTSRIFRCFQRTSSSPDTFGRTHPEWYEHPQHHPDTLRVIEAVKAGYYKFWRPPGEVVATVEELEKIFQPSREFIMKAIEAGPTWDLEYETRDQIDLKTIRGASGQEFPPNTYWALFSRMQSYGLVEGVTRSGAAVKARQLRLTRLGKWINERLSQNS